MMEIFWENDKRLGEINCFRRKNSIADVWLGSTYASDWEGGVDFN